ncbi:Flap endonuclease 1-B [Stylophora pistillata]|uniref:Exonuclease 1 n=1 Tax=Stylophora pistillata TaxID=50429 RepID=A0A2B4SQ10_STYPI|nr:Flap endonuclease 1-B [Stylophora pistillata]
MVKTSMSGDGECFVLSHVLESLKLSMNEFRKVCIAAGCDHLKNVRGIGIQRAFKMVAAGKLKELLGKGGAPEDYWESFFKAEAVFQHQTVFNLGTCSTVPLEKCETNPPAELRLLDDLYSNNLAIGNVNTKTGKQTLTRYPLFTIVSD